MIPIAKYIRTHTSAENAVDYTPVFTDLNPGGSILGGSVGSYSPLYYAVHNYSSDQEITIWTVDQGTSGSGVTIYLLQGHTFFARIAKLTVTDPVTLLGTTNVVGLV